MSEQSLALIDGLQSKIHACLEPFITDEPLAIMDFPDIRNVGDSAIWLGEMAYLKARFRKRPSYVCTIQSYSDADLAAALPEGPIFIHGGGNFGDIWLAHQTFRERIMERWPNRKIIQFPQSIHYGTVERADETARAIAKHSNFTLMVRDEESLHFARAKFDCEVILCPDMAFCIGQTAALGAPQFPVLAMLREDKEKVGDRDVSSYPGQPVEDWITEDRSKVRMAKAIGAAMAVPTLDKNKIRLGKLQAAAENRYRRGVTQLSRGKAVVTDRLHVHIISLLMGKPHAVLDNSYQKIGRFMKAFSGGTDLSYPASSFDDAMAWAQARAQDMSA